MMWMNKKGSRKKLLSPEQGAKILQSCAENPMDPKNLALVTDDAMLLLSLNRHIYLTKAAIIINWLRLAARSEASSSREEAILNIFEELVLTSFPKVERALLLEHIQDLIVSVTELHAIASSKGSSKEETSVAMLHWCKDWLEHVSDDEVFLKRSSLEFAGPFFIYIHGVMGQSAKNVQAVLWEEQ